MQSQSRELPDAAEWIPLKLIQTREQPRHYFDPEKLEQLTQSIAQHGILEPLLVRPLKSSHKSKRYELVAGERRYRAALKLALARVPVVIRQLNDEEAIQLALIENLQREDLNPIEETEGVLQLLALKLNLPAQAVPALLYQMKNGLEKSGTRNNSLRNNSIPSFRSPQEQEIQAVFQSLGLMSWLSFTCNRLPLLNLPPEVLEAIHCGRITYTKALAISRIKDQEQRQLLLGQAIDESLSLKQIRAAIKQLKPLPERNPLSERPSPQTQIAELHQRLLRTKLWEDPQRWQQAQTLLAQLEALLEPDEEPR